MNFITELDVLIDVSKRLQAASIDYMLTGSFAMNYYAEPRMTRDIDIVIEARLQNRQLLYGIFQDNYYISQDNLDEALRNCSMFNIIHNDTVTKVDLIIRKNDEYGIQAFRRRRLEKLNGSQIYIISKEDLILSKIQWSKESESHLQRKDIVNLLETGFDRDYLFDNLRKNGIFEFTQEFIGERHFS